jgi:tRNA A37 threonylcarbamoyladenosine biosynthesis protein TsaE
MNDKIVQSVVDKYQQRSEVGQKKYGVNLERNDLSLLEWLNHLQEELMDATLYIQKLKQEVEENQSFTEGHIVTTESWNKAHKITKDGFIYIKYKDLVFNK